MARSLNDFIAELPPERQAQIEARYQDLKQEVEGLRELRLSLIKVEGHATDDHRSPRRRRRAGVSGVCGF